MALVDSPLSPVRIISTPRGMIAEFSNTARLFSALADVEAGIADLDWNRFQRLRTVLTFGRIVAG